MKTNFYLKLSLIVVLCACSKNETPENTEPANYVETREKLIQNPENDSVKQDTAQVPTAMPPQPKP